jgi:tetratricopeptide (TPR) repeat protein
MKDRINEIRNAIVEYCKENLNEQYKDMSLDLLAKIEQKDGELLTSSRCDIWVAAILNMVLEDAEMFKRKHPMYITKKAFSEKTGVSSKTIKSKSDALRALFEGEETVVAEAAVTAENTVEVVQAEEVKVEATKELTEDETKSAKYKALMGLAHEDLPFEDRLDYLRQAMAVAEEMIVDRENTTNYWNNESARPYMIAAQDLATLLMNNKNHKEAREMFELLLKMDENDTQGNRYKLINLLIAKNDRKAVNDLFARFKNEDSAQWDYFKALYYFKNGNLYFAKSAIKDGVEKNKYIGLFLMQWTAALRMSGSVIDPVLYTEATYYYNENFALWKSTKGALKWLVNAVVK